MEKNLWEILGQNVESEREKKKGRGENGTHFKFRLLVRKTTFHGQKSIASLLL